MPSTAFSSTPYSSLVLDKKRNLFLKNYYFVFFFLFLIVLIYLYFINDSRIIFFVVEVGSARMSPAARDRQRSLSDPADEEKFLFVIVFATVVAHPALEQFANEQQRIIGCHGVTGGGSRLQ